MTSIGSKRITWVTKTSLPLTAASPFRYRASELLRCQAGLPNDVTQRTDHYLSVARDYHYNRPSAVELHKFDVAAHWLT